MVALRRVRGGQHLYVPLAAAILVSFLAPTSAFAFVPCLGASVTRAGHVIGSGSQYSCESTAWALQRMPTALGSGVGGVWQRTPGSVRRTGALRLHAQVRGSPTHKGPSRSYQLFHLCA